jgi:hypothetical protein
MSIMSKSTPLTVYKSGFAPTLDDLLKAKFMPIDDTADPVSRGFVNIDDYLDTAWAKSHPARGRFVTFSFRIDTRRIPGAVLKKKYQLALAAELEELKKRTGLTALRKNRKQEIKDQVTLKLLARTEPAPAVFDVVVDPTSSTVLLCSASKSVKEAFEAHWSAHFEDRLVEQTPDILANDMTATAQDFLTSVFTKTMELPIGRLYVPNKAVVVSEADKTAMSLEAPESVELTTLSAPLTDGKVIKATVVLEDNESGATFTLTTRATDFGITGFKTPIVKPDPEDPDGALLEKVYFILTAVGLLHTAYRTQAGVVTTAADF